MKVPELFTINKIRATIIIILEIIFVTSITVSSYIVNFAYNQLSIGHFYKYTLTILISITLSLLAAILNSLAIYFYSKQTQSLNHKIRANIIDNYYYGNDYNLASVQNNLTNNLHILNIKVANPILRIFNSTLLLVVSTITLISWHWILAAIVLILGSITLSIPFLTKYMTSKATEKVTIENAKYLATIFNWFNGLEELRRFAAFDKLNVVLQTSSKKLEDSYIKQQKTISIAQCFNGCANSISQIIVMTVAAILFFNKQVSFGVIIAAGSFSLTIFIN